MRIGLAQINTTVGDIAGNAEKILDSIRRADEEGCDLVLFPELALVGYPPEDLLFKKTFVSENLTALKEVAPLIKKSAAVIGFVDRDKKGLYNAAAWVEKGRVRAVYHKSGLPNYGVFDEKRYFQQGHKPVTMTINKIKVGLTICEDIWEDPIHLNPLRKHKPQLTINISASPFHANKSHIRHEVARRAAKHLKSPLIYLNLTGGQDELIFDGGSFITDKTGRTIGNAPSFTTGLYTVDFSPTKNPAFKLNWPQPQKSSSLDDIHAALCLGIRDYTHKNGFKKVMVAISGGIDSALTAALAVDALGSDRVIGVTMPSRFNSKETVQDSVNLASNLGIELHQIPIENLFKENINALSPIFRDLPPGLAEENLQARIRGVLMMAISNKFGWLVLTTGNKSEVSTGYCTLYGDTAGGFAVLKDVLKTTVYALSRRINERAKKEIIPETTITRPPSAELRFDQRDDQSLGSYDDLDPIVVGYVENNLSIKEIQKATKLPLEHIQRIITLIDRNEYKRRQAPPGIKITPRAFGRDHRMPITNKFRNKS